MVKSYIKIAGVLICILLLLGCAPPREKPNKDEAKHSSGSSDLDDSMDILQRLGLELNLDDIAALGENNDEGVSNLLPDPQALADMSPGEREDLNEAIAGMEQTLNDMDDPNSFQAAYVHLYLGYAQVLDASAELLTAGGDLANAITKNDTTNQYKFNVPFDTTSDTTSDMAFDGDPASLSPEDIIHNFDTTYTDPDQELTDEQKAIAQKEMQALLNAVYILTGESYAPPAGWADLGVTGPDSPPHETNALGNLEQAVGLVGDILPDADPEELDKLKDDINSGITDDLSDALKNWGCTPL